MAKIPDSKIVEIARRGQRTPGMITAGEIALLATAYLEKTGMASLPDGKPVEKPPVKRGRKKKS